MPISPAAQIAGLQRRKERFDTRLQWFGDRVARNIRIGLTARLRLAAQLLRDKTVINISRPVTKEAGTPTRSGGAGGTSKTFTRVTNRSKPGEFPKAESTLLMKTLFWQMRGPDTAIVGTPLDYGLVLETNRRLNRSFLRRTHREMLPTIRRIITAGGPPLPGQE